MLIKPLYDAYLRKLEIPFEAAPESLFSPIDFLMLPYQMRLNLAGAKVRIKANFPESHVLSNYLEGGTYEIPKTDLKDYHSRLGDKDTRRFCLLSWDDVHLIGDTHPDSAIATRDMYMLFPFEYEIVL